MEAIFDTLFGNILVLLAIVGGIAGFIKDKSKKADESSKRYPTPKPTKTPSGGYQVASDEGSQRMSMENQQGNVIDEQQGTHLHRAVKNGEHDAIPESTLRRPPHDSDHKSRLKREIRHNLSKQGLVNNIIMSEVLGPPRATKPYKSVTAERRKK